MLDMSTVAEQLRRARESRNLSLQQVGDITKIRTDHIRALEEGNFDVFSAPVYIRGFVRTYATLLKLNVPEVMSQLDAELGESRKHAEPPPLSGERSSVIDGLMLQLSKLDWAKGAIVLGILVVLVAVALGILLARIRATADPAAGVKPGLYEPKRTSGGQTLPLPQPGGSRP